MTRKKQTISIVVLSKTTYKVVGMMTDTAYSHLQIGDITVDYTTQRIQGQDNPTAGGANPVIDMKCPNVGACFKVNVKKDGYLYVAVKSTPNKQQFVFEGVVESNGVVAGTMVGFQYLSMSRNTGAAFGNPNGGVCVEYVGTGDFNELMAPPAMPCNALSVFGLTRFLVCFVKIRIRLTRLSDRLTNLLRRLSPVGFDATNKEQKCTVQALDCLTGEELTALENTTATKVARKVITADGQLQLIMADGTVFNVLGTTIK